MESAESTSVQLSTFEQGDNSLRLHTEEDEEHRQPLREEPGSGVETFPESGSLHPADHGLNAWLFLAGSFLIEALVWGFSFSFGIFQEYYSRTDPFSKESGRVATISTTATGIMYMLAPVTFAALIRFPRIRRISGFVGLMLMCIAFVASSFANSVTELIVFQGVLYALGGSIAYAPAILFMDEWFIRRKGLAFGIMWAGTGLGGFALPLIFSAALRQYSFRTVLRAWAIALFVLITPTLYFMKPRLPPSRVRKIDLAFLKNPIFILMQIGNIVESLGYFLPGIFLPTFARDLGASEFPSSLTVVLLNVASVGGCVMMGALCDRLKVTTCIGISTAGATLGILLVWGLSGSLAPLLVFSVIYGVFAGSFTSTWPGVMRLISTKVARAEPIMVFAFLAAGRGVGNVVSGPLSDKLIEADTWKGGDALGYSSGYGSLILFTGLTALFGGLGLTGRFKKGLIV